VEGSESDDAFQVDLPALDAGTWWWQVKVTDGTNTYYPASGDISVDANLFDQSGEYDGRNNARKALDAIDAVLGGKATQDQQSYTIKGRSLTRYTVADLLKLRTSFVVKVNREKGKSGFRKIGVRY